jgi:hypothetical protein
MDVYRCPYCGNEAKLVDSSIVYGKSYGKIWDCRPCDAYVGVHKNNDENIPLGRLANRELRHWKIKAHDAFDPLWKSKKMNRKSAYSFMQEIMGLTPEQAHIGLFDVEQCKLLIEKLQLK